MNLRENPANKPPAYQRTYFSPRDCLPALSTSVRFLKGVGPKRAAQLESLGLKTVEDLLYHLPFRYEDRREIKKIRYATIGKEENFIGRLISIQKRFIPRRRRSILLGTLADESGILGLVWYHATPYLVRGLQKGQELLVHGKVERGLGAQKRIVHPEFEPVEPGEDRPMERILPVYLRPGGVSIGTIRRWAQQALDGYGKRLTSYLPEEIVRRQNLLDLQQSMEQVHRPQNDSDLSALNRFSSPGHRSIVFDELFYLQLGLGLRRKMRNSQNGIAFARKKESLTQRMKSFLAFKLTGAQRRVLEEVARDMESSQPMQRLIQGDVGCGKTIIAWFAALRAIENGFQAIWMAPTELLAEQHFRNLKGFAESLGVSAELLTGSLPAKAKRAIAERIERGEISFLVGTHALIQEGVRAPRMGLGIIDEQHRFGVVQRMALQHLTDGWASTPVKLHPDILLMSATPIPRSLAMVLYGDLEVSSVDELPPGRKPVVTKLFHDEERSAVYEAVRAEVRKGYQAFIVFPLVEPSEELRLRDATRMAEELSRGLFRDCRVGLIHGRMGGEERDEVMRTFQNGHVQILVATTVIEVGIDIPRATVMVIEHAERFGLSQLHQLRGRVGRGDAPAQCLLVYYGSGNADAVQRLKVMERERDGFKIAEADLALRGPGEFLGTRQSGLADFRTANLARDSELLQVARQEALNWLAIDPNLQRPESAMLREILKERWERRLELGGIG